MYFPKVNFPKVYFPKAYFFLSVFSQSVFSQSVYIQTTLNHDLGVLILLFLAPWVAKILLAPPAPCAENDKINVLDEPHFGTHILGNYLPFQTSEIPKKNTQPLISIRGLAFNKLLRSSEKRKFHSFRVSLRETLT